MGGTVRELGWIKNAEIQEKNQQKVLCLCRILQMSFRPLYEGMNFCGQKSTKFKKNIVKKSI